MCDPNQTTNEISEASDPSVPSVFPGKRSGRGGRRPGAGAPRGNLNALKHGRRSRQFAEIGAIIAASDTTRATLFALAQRRRTKDARAEETAAQLIANIYIHARDIAAGKDSGGPFRHLLGLNEGPKALTVAQSNQRHEILNRSLLAIRKELAENAADNQPLPQQSSRRSHPDTNEPPEAND
jgi:hypothetical protein